MLGGISIPIPIAWWGGYVITLLIFLTCRVVASGLSAKTIVMIDSSLCNRIFDMSLRRETSIL